VTGASSSAPIAEHCSLASQLANGLKPGELPRDDIASCTAKTGSLLTPRRGSVVTARRPCGARPWTHNNLEEAGPLGGRETFTQSPAGELQSRQPRRSAEGSRDRGRSLDGPKLLGTGNPSLAREELRAPGHPGAECWTAVQPSVPTRLQESEALRSPAHVDALNAWYIGDSGIDNGGVGSSAAVAPLTIENVRRCESLSMSNGDNSTRLASQVPARPTPAGPARTLGRTLADYIGLPTRISELKKAWPRIRAVSFSARVCVSAGELDSWRIGPQQCGEKACIP
jgi:hypothetical protein